MIGEFFNQGQTEAIAKALGDTADGLSGSEIEYLLQIARIEDTDPQATKWIRLFNAFCNVQNKKRNRTNILEFIRQAMRPEKYINKKERFETLRFNLNQALSFCGLEITDAGKLQNSTISTTLSEAELKAIELRHSLEMRKIHPDVLIFCRSELLQNNYFHAVLEAVKSIFDKLKKITDIDLDGHAMADKCFASEYPIVKINSHTLESEKTEQRGFNNLVKGIYSMFRTPLAHEAKVNWEITKEDAEDLLTLVSLIHRRLDKATIEK